MEYNTKRTRLTLPEYGRIIQSLVDRCRGISDKTERNEMANAIVEFMAQRSTSQKDEEDFQQKLWDRLFILADYDLDVDTPFPKITQDIFLQKPKRMEYPKVQEEFKFYGKSILQLIEKAIDLEESELIEVIANNMKKSYNIYNREHVSNDVIFRHLKELSDNRLDLTNIDTLEKSRIYHSNKKNSANRNNHNKRKNHNNKRR